MEITSRTSNDRHERDYFDLLRCCWLQLPTIAWSVAIRLTDNQIYDQTREQELEEVCSDLVFAQNNYCRGVNCLVEWWYVCR